MISIVKRKVEAHGIQGKGEETLLRDMVRQNILYFDPTEAKYYPQGKSFHNGIKAYFERRTASTP
ncbi:MAG TPA: hypothetical protein VK469_08130 [Candidatus Kapabacteria bacterium]|nr:hypothetical protein [Candidatus Kapabacteria bacterium]